MKQPELWSNIFSFMLQEIINLALKCLGNFEGMEHFFNKSSV